MCRIRASQPTCSVYASASVSPTCVNMTALRPCKHKGRQQRFSSAETAADPSSHVQIRCSCALPSKEQRQAHTLHQPPATSLHDVAVTSHGLQHRCVLGRQHGASHSPIPCYLLLSAQRSRACRIAAVLVHWGGPLPLCPRPPTSRYSLSHHLLLSPFPRPPTNI